MIARPFAVLLFTALLVLLTMPVAAQCSKQHHEMLYTSTLVEADGGMGSGTVIYSAADDGEWTNLVLTNFHVIDSAVTVSEEWDPKKQQKIQKERREQVIVKWYDYNDCSRSIGTRGKRAEVVAYDKAADLALLRLLDTESGIQHVAALLPETDSINLMDEVWAVGAGLGEPPFPTKGNLAGLDKQIDGYDYLFATAPIIFGNSGGGLFRFSRLNDRFEFIGVPSRVRASGWGSVVPHMSFHIAMKTVRSFLRANDFGFVVDARNE